MYTYIAIQKINQKVDGRKGGNGIKTKYIINVVFKTNTDRYNHTKLIINYVTMKLIVKIGIVTI